MIESLLYKNLVYKIQGALFEVYKTLGSGFKEVIYQKATNYKLGLLVNFGSDKKVDIRRKIYETARNSRKF